ncbi:MAG: RelA/SpoT family protein [Patescibacteria group bacterium]|mgnify:CR=1 FL=1
MDEPFIEEITKEPLTIDHLLKVIAETNPKADLEFIRLAYEFAEHAHEGQKRKTGEAYIIHPLAAAIILAHMQMDQSIIITALLHDVPEDTSVTLEDIEKNFGKDIAEVVAGITKLGKLKYRGVERYIENLRKMFVAVANDVRVMIVKFADRLHNLTTLEALPPKKQYRIALESLEIYAPIANRLGMGDMKGRLEDAAFRYVYPKEYRWVVSLVKERYAAYEEYLGFAKETVEKELRSANVPFIEIQSRMKRLYSVYQKLLKHDRDIEKLHDLIALRIVVPTVADCYATLGTIHKLWRPLKGRIKDYIAQPKPNGYQSLHTTVFGENGRIVEFQIRTQQMHEEAEYGIAAHWHYDERGSAIPTKRLAWIQELAELQKNLIHKIKDLDALKIDVFQNRIFVFTPKGDVIDLPEAATPVDFAYAIHSDIGNTATGARVNEQVMSLSHELKSGDVIEILVDKRRKGPSADWLKFVKTHHAKECIRQHAKKGIASWIMERFRSTDVG